ncbi:NAD(P)H-hydrate dehydratase [Candidatus Micrarchaeota archaeon]|nr:NAD(P)H-hydrate dehydratase [Candidatus Micrarchaeota archaeon]
MVFEVSSKFVLKHLKRVDPASHKGVNGRVGVVGGCRLFFGAPALVGFGALRSGADLAYLTVPNYISRTVAGYSPDFIVRDFEGEEFNEKGLSVALNLRSSVDCFVVGSGLGKNEEALSCVSYFFKSVDVPLIVDADALNASTRFPSNSVLTPHAGEFKRLSGFLPSTSLRERCAQAEKTAKKLGCVVLLKGPTDVISDGEQTAYSSTGNAGMTVGGTGDVLAGVLGALVSQKHSLFEAACMAAFLNGAAGSEAFKKLGYSLLATDVANNLPTVLKKYKK